MVYSSSSSSSPSSASSSFSLYCLNLVQGNKEGTLLRTTFLALRKEMSVAALLYLLHVGCILSTALLIFQLLKWVNETEPQFWVGFLWVVGLMACGVLAFAFRSGFESRMKRCGLIACTGARGLLITAISHQSTVESGNVSALFSSDSLVLSELWEGIVTVLLTTVEALAVILLLYYFVGLATLGGLGVVVFAFCAIQLSTKQMEKYNDERSDYTSLRTRDTLEMLLGMKMVKLRGLESKFERRILEQRQLESACTLRARGWMAMTNVCSACSVDGISLAIIGIYTQFYPCDPTVIFTYWVLLGQLYGCTCILPIALHQVKLGLTAARRIQAEVARISYLSSSSSSSLSSSSAAAAEFVSSSALLSSSSSLLSSSSSSSSSLLSSSSSAAAAEFVSFRSSTSIPSSPVSVSLLSASFAWPDTLPLLSDISLQVPAGSMLGIVGAVGSGKTSLLCALLEELKLMDGEVSFSDRRSRPPVGYVPQQAWILPSSARANIVMGREWDAERYAAVVKACALETDFEQWPKRDMTDIGSFTISGGQKQRLSLARASYGKEALYLLDDCLSALDQTVARHVLEHLLLGLLRDSTRIVITSSRAVLERCDSYALMLPSSASSSFSLSSSSSSSACILLNDVYINEDKNDSVNYLEQETSPLTTNHVNAHASHMYTDHTHTTTIANNISSGDQNHSDMNNNNNNNIADVTNNNNNSITKSKNNNHNFTLVNFTHLRDLFAHPIGSAILTEQISPPAEAPPPPSSSLFNSLLEQPETQDASVLLTKGVMTRLSVFRSWAMGLNGLGCAGGLLLLTMIEVAVVEGGVVWMQYWSETLPIPGSAENTKWVLIYGVFVLGEWTFRFIRILCLFTCTAYAGDKLHAKLLHTLTRAPMSVFDSKSVGELYVWFGPCLSQLDTHTALASEIFVVQIMYLFQISIFNAVVSPWSLLVSVISFIMFLFVLRGERESSSSSSSSNKNNNVKEKKKVEEEERGENESLRQHMKKSEDFFAPLELNRKQSETNSKGSNIPQKNSFFSHIFSLCYSSSSSLSVAELRGQEHRLQTPVLITFSQLLEGLSSIRAFCMENKFLSLHHVLTDSHVEAWQKASEAEQRQVLISNLVGMFAHSATAFLIVPLRLLTNIRASEAGFLVINACFCSFFFLNAVTEFGRLRRLALTRSLLLDPIYSLPSEEEEEEEGKGDKKGERRGRVYEKPPLSWPSAGQLEILDVWARYAPDLPPVLCGVSLCVRPGEKIGVVGRTGSGKSSLLAAIARTIQLYQGRMAIDGLDLSRVPLKELRSRGVTVVTQDPLLFAGSLRKNLDPFSEFSDEELCEVLDRVKLCDFAEQSIASASKNYVKNESSSSSSSSKEGGGSRHSSGNRNNSGPLDFIISERGNNLSAGQKQLLAIAQAILRKPRVLLLDEATAALDRASEAAIEATIQQEFKGVTMILVAHRLSSVLNSDRVLVMSDGRVGELDPPSVLLQNPNGLLTKLVHAQRQGQPL